MIKRFTKNHPWLTKQIKKHYWNLLNTVKVKSILYKFMEDGQRIKIETKDDSVGKSIFLGNYEKNIVSFISRYINLGDYVVDVGANIGFFTLIFSKLVGENGEVHSFEPSQREFLSLCENVEINNSRNVFLNQVALSNINGYSKMNVFSESKFGAYNSLQKISHKEVKEERIFIEHVRTLKFDDYLSLFTNSIPILMKIDVEGFEKQVLEGMHDLLILDNSPCLIVEICEDTHKTEPGSIQEIVDYIESFGYQLYGPNSVGNLTPFNIRTSLNCIALRQSHLIIASNRGIKVVNS